MKKKYNLITQIKKYFNDSKKYYHEHWSYLDSVLLDIYHKDSYPTKREVMASKITLLARVYGAGIDRHWKKKKGEFIPDLITEYFYKNRHKIDSFVKRITSIGNQLTENNLATIITIHSKFDSLLREETRKNKKTDDNNSLRSFVSKYLHFHNPIVPIYDSRSKNALNHLCITADISFNECKDVDQEYAKHCRLFYKVFSEIRKKDKKATVKEVDNFLLYWWS